MITLIDIYKLEAFTSSSADGQHTFTVSPTGSVIASIDGEMVGVKLLELGSPTTATAYAKITLNDVTGATGTIFDRNGSGSISGATPAFYPVRQYAVDNTGLTIGSPNSAGMPFPVRGDLTISLGSLGSPVDFSGMEIWIRK